tara:strand:- start:7 stop:702 length:696 start_codon:yes stop_codon:yes gene_type:complete
MNKIRLIDADADPEETTPDKTDEEIEQEIQAALEQIMIQPRQPQSQLRVAEMYGDIDEKMASDVISAFLILQETGREEELSDPLNPDSEAITTYKPFELIISTAGGTAVDMFSIYDMMRNVQDDCEIHTFGLGRVMSAGVVLLAAGTKGKRKIGANCRVMIHSVIGGHHGAIHDLENEMEEVRWVQEQYNKALCAETDLTPRMLKKLMSRNVNVYLTAQEAVEYGIADIIV